MTFELAMKKKKKRKKKKMKGRVYITAYKLAVFEILRDIFVLAYITCPHYPYMEFIDSMMHQSSTVNNLKTTF